MTACDNCNSDPDLNDANNWDKQLFAKNLVSILDVPVLGTGVLFLASGLAEYLSEKKMLILLSDFKINLPEIIKLPVRYFDIPTPNEKFGVSIGLMFLGGILHGLNNKTQPKRKID